MLKHAGDTTSTLPKTQDFSPLSEFSVGTAVRQLECRRWEIDVNTTGEKGELALVSEFIVHWRARLS
jgi:hypothetical protein